MNNKIYFLLPFLCILSIQTVQAQNLGWAKRIGGILADSGYGVTTDAAGNSYSVGTFGGTVNFEQGTNTYLLMSLSNAADIFIAKRTPAGDLLWLKQISGDGSKFPGTISLDTDHNLIVSGIFSGDVDFDPGAGQFQLSTDTLNTFVLKLDPTGDFIWAKQFGGASGSRCSAHVVDAANNIYFAGEFSGTADFASTTLTATGNNDGYVAKLNPAGNLIWVKQTEGIGEQLSQGLTLDAAANVYLTGGFEGVIDFDSSPGVFNLNATSTSDIYITKLNSAGNWIWTKQFGDVYGYGGATGIDSDGNLYVTGSFLGSIDFDPGAGVNYLSSGVSEITYLLKMTANGDFIWAKKIEGNTIGTGFVMNAAQRMIIDAADNVYLTGLFANSADFDPGSGVFNLIANGDLDVYILKLDASGNFEWAGHVGGVDQERIYGLAVDVDNSVYLTGYFQSSPADFDPGIGTLNLSPIGGGEAFLVKIEQTPTGIILPDNSLEADINIYPNPASETVFLDLSKLQQEVSIQLSNVSGQILFNQTAQPNSPVGIKLPDSSGIYFINVSDESGKSAIFKVVKKDK